VITLNGANPQEVYKGAAYTDPGAVVADDVDAPQTIQGSGTVDTSVLGVYTITYAATDAAGNAAEPITRTVNVVFDPAGDEDGDGLTNEEEESLGTDPENSDTDGDGVSDYREQKDETDPKSLGSFDPLSKGLVAYYPFNGTYANESGAIAYAIPKNSVEFIDDPLFGNVAKISGDGFVGESGGSIEVPAPTLNQENLFTASFWIKENGMSHWHGESYLTAGTGAGSRYLLAHFGLGNNPVFATNNFLTENAGTDENFNISNSEITDKWNHYVILEQDGTARVFMNGIEIYSRNTSGVPRGNWHIGRHWWDGGASESTRLIASVSNLRIYNRALTASEILQLYTRESRKSRYALIIGNFTWDEAKADAEARGIRRGYVQSAPAAALYRELLRFGSDTV
jgi:hypothetical protein